MKKWAKISTIVGSGVLLAGAGAGTVAGIVIPKTLKLKKGLGHFVPDDGESPMRHWNAQKKLNYVALGDSETAGFNGFMQGTPELGGGVDYVSYADILASDLRHSGNLNEYHNYAVSGATIPDQEKLFGEHPLIHKTIKEADLITVTIGANDLLSFVRLLDLPFRLSLDGLLSTLKGKITDYNATRDAIFGAGGDLALPQSESTSEGPSESETNEMLHRSINLLADMVQSGNYSHIINLEHDFKEKIFDMIYRNFMMFIHDLREVAPHAQIIVLGHAMPFAQWPSSNVLDSPRPDMGGQTIRGLYQKMITKMREGTTFSLTGTNNYATFLEVDQLRIRKSADGTHETDSRDNGSRVFTDYIKRDINDPGFYVRNAMPNAADIHPSTFGHQLIGNAVYDHIAPSLGVSNSLSNYTYTQPFDGIYEGPKHVGEDGYEDAVRAQVGLFERLDENPKLSHAMSSTLLDVLNNRSGMVSKMLKLILPYLRDIKDYSGLHDLISNGSLQEIMSKVSEIKTGNAMTKFIRVIADPANAKLYTTLKNDLSSLFNASEKSKPLGVAIISVLDLLKSNNPFSAILMRPLGNVFNDKVTKRHYDSIKEYLLGEFGIKAEKTTKAEMLKYMDDFKVVANNLLKVVNNRQEDYTDTDLVITDLAGDKTALATTFDTFSSNVAGLGASDIATQYEVFRQQIENSMFDTDEHGNKITTDEDGNPLEKIITIGTPTSLDLSDVFNYAIVTSIVDKNSTFNVTILQIIGILGS